MKLIASLDRACETRMRSAARPRLLLLGLIGFALVAPLLSGSAIAAVTGADKPASMVASAGMLGGLALTGPLREEDPGAPQGGGSDLAKADDPKLTIGQRLSAALASKTSLQASIAERDTKISEHAAEIERLKTELATAQGELTKANTRITALEADAAEVDKALKSAETEAKELKAKETTVEKKAQEKVASLGFSAAKLPAAEDFDPAAAVPSTRAELEEAMSKLPNLQERAALLTRYEQARAAAA
jgi:hypothetical protein